MMGVVVKAVTDGGITDVESLHSSVTDADGRLKLV
jgi:hypothetical protein